MGFAWKQLIEKESKQEAHGPRFTHLIKTAIAYLQIPYNFFQYCHSN